MSKDKSRLKLVLREPPLAEAIALVAYGERYQHADGIRAIFDDGSIRFSSISSSMSGADVFASFTRAITSAFAEYPNAHTYVMCFDDKRHVPSRKAATQAARRQAMASSSAALASEWAWDGESTIVDSHSHAPLPPWEHVRLDAAAYRSALNDVAEALLRHYAPPAGRRLIVDWSGGRRIVETSLDGDVIEPYDDVAEKPRIGEADISAQYYAVRGVHDETSSLETCVVARARVPTPDEHAVYYRDVMSDVPREQRALARTTTRVIDARTSTRRLFEAGDVLLRSTDTDFVSLALAVEACNAHRPQRVHVCLGSAHVQPSSGEYCTSKAPGAEHRLEMYDIRALAHAVRRLHGAPVECTESLWSFVAFCIACGNDYTKRLHGFSHARFFEAYKYIARQGTRLVRVSSERPPLIDARAFMRFVRAAYYIRLPEARRPISWSMDDELPTYSELSSVVRSPAATTTSMPDADALERYFEQICWSLMYAACAVRGIEHVPEPVHFSSASPP